MFLTLEKLNIYSIHGKVSTSFQSACYRFREAFLSWIAGTQFSGRSIQTIKFIDDLLSVRIRIPYYSLPRKNTSASRLAFPPLSLFCGLAHWPRSGAQKSHSKCLSWLLPMTLSFRERQFWLSFVVRIRKAIKQSGKLSVPAMVKERRQVKTT